jgi:hypothetical protein
MSARILTAYRKTGKKNFKIKTTLTNTSQHAHLPPFRVTISQPTTRQVRALLFNNAPACVHQMLLVLWVLERARRRATHRGRFCV